MILALVALGGILEQPGGAVAPLVPPGEARALAARVADTVLKDFPEPPPFDWGEGVLMSGMLRAAALTGEARHRDFVVRFARHWKERGITATLAAKGYCGHWGPAFAMIELHESDPAPGSLALAQEVIAFMRQKAERTRDGGLSHFHGKPQLWVDTLDMCCPPLAHGARVCGQPEWRAEAARQLEIFASRLRDPATGLWYHLWDDATATRSTSFWARGNGWAVMALVETLKNEPAGSDTAARLRPLLESLLATLARRQDPATGLWHTILDDPQTYLESSAPAMFLYGMAETRRLKLAQAPDAEVMRKAWAGLKSRVDASGRLTGVSGGTRPGTKAQYAAVPTGTYTWGTGALLLAAWACAQEMPGP